uniref:Uncharacterized protein n=1 Tax=Sphaerodactylus townsendi TaxID=933632 RepID=A0ACB8F993_9SAUR
MKELKNLSMEALEVHKSHFIYCSQERLKKLEHMVQLRKAQQGDASGKKQGAVLSRKLSSSSILSKKKQYTVPHPLSETKRLAHKLSNQLQSKAEKKACESMDSNSALPSQ